jgi:hypothetical protein
LIIVVILVSGLDATAHVGKFKEIMMPYVRPLAVFLGLEQSWQVFAPNPRFMNLHNTAVITFQDGSMKMYEYPRMDLIKGWERFQVGDRQRKLFDEWMSEPRGIPYRPFFARNLVKANLNPDNQPVFNFIEMGRPDQKLISLVELPPHRNKSVIFVFQIRQSDLK